MKTLRIYQDKKLVDTVCLRNPPVEGAYIFAGKPGRVLVATYVALCIEDGIYDVYCDLKDNGVV